MVDKIKRCIKCGAYTLKDTCKCNGECVSPKPAKYSPLDKYSKYRIKYKQEVKS